MRRTGNPVHIWRSHVRLTDVPKAVWTERIGPGRRSEGGVPVQIILRFLIQVIFFVPVRKFPQFPDIFVWETHCSQYGESFSGRLIYRMIRFVNQHIIISFLCGWIRKSGMMSRMRYPDDHDRGLILTGFCILLRKLAECLIHLHLRDPLFPIQGDVQRVGLQAHRTLRSSFYHLLFVWVNPESRIFPAGFFSFIRLISGNHCSGLQSCLPSSLSEFR